MSGDCFEAVDFLFKLYGIWMDISSKYKMVAYIVWDSIVLFLGCGFTALEAMMIKASLKDLNLFFKVFGIFLGHQLALLKFGVIMTNYRKISSLKRKLRSRCFSYDPYDLFDPEKMMSESARVCTKFSTFVFMAYGMVGVSAHVSALWRLNTEQKGKYFQGNSTCDDFLPYVFVNPFDDGSIRGCKNALLMMDVCFYFLATYMAGFDGIFGCLMICLDTQLQILNIATKNVRERLLIKSGLPRDYGNFYDDMSPDFEEKLYMEIRKCNRHLSFLLRISEDIDELFSFIMLLQCLTSSFMVASNLYVASITTPSDPEFYSTTQCMMAVLAQLSVICHLCGRITETSSSYVSCLYECSWYSSSKRFKTCMLIMMTRLQIPLEMKAGKFLPLKLPTIISIVKRSFSYSTMYTVVGQR